jgi:hypothetical protein
MEIETRSFQMQNKSLVLSQCYAVTAGTVNYIIVPNQAQVRVVREASQARSPAARPLDPWPGHALMESEKSAGMMWYRMYQPVSDNGRRWSVIRQQVILSGSIWFDDRVQA